MLQNNSNYHILGYLLPKLIFTQRMLDECLYYFRIGLEPPDYIFLKFEHCLCKGGESGIYIVGGRASVCVRLVVGRAKGGSKRRGSGSGGGRPLAHHSERVTARVQGNRRWICDAISKPIQWVFLSEKRSSDLFFHLLFQSLKYGWNFSLSKNCFFHIHNLISRRAGLLQCYIEWLSWGCSKRQEKKLLPRNLQRTNFKNIFGIRK